MQWLPPSFLPAFLPSSLPSPLSLFFLFLPLSIKMLLLNTTKMLKTSIICIYGFHNTPHPYPAWLFGESVLNYQELYVNVIISIWSQKPRLREGPWAIRWFHWEALSFVPQGITGEEQVRVFAHSVSRKRNGKVVTCTQRLHLVKTVLLSDVKLLQIPLPLILLKEK